MCAKQPKKILILNILEILRKYTDADHRLSQTEIIEKLKADYGITVNRKTVKANITDLIDFGCDIKFSETTRRDGTVVCSDFYINREFADEELRTLIDSLLFYKYIPYNRCRRLVGKLEGLSSVHFKYKMRRVVTVPEKYPPSSRLFSVISVIDESIEKKVKIKFKYRNFDTSKKLKNQKLPDGRDKVYTVAPYRLAAVNSRYYLICSSDKNDNISYFRVDRIADIVLTDEPALPIKKLTGCENGLDLPKYMAEYIHMFSGKSETVVFRAKKELVTQIIDWFGMDVTLFDDKDGEISVSVTVNTKAMHRWAMQYANYVRVISPKELADSIGADLRAAAEKYNK